MSKIGSKIFCMSEVEEFLGRRGSCQHNWLTFGMRGEERLVHKKVQRVCMMRIFVLREL